MNRKAIVIAVITAIVFALLFIVLGVSLATVRSGLMVSGIILTVLGVGIHPSLVNSDSSPLLQKLKTDIYGMEGKHQGAADKTFYLCGLAMIAVSILLNVIPS